MKFIAFLASILTVVEVSVGQSATTPTSQPALQAIDLRFGHYLSRVEVWITVSPQGLVQYTRTEMKSYGTGDINPQNERHESRQGRLTPEQREELTRMLAGWESLSDKPYPNVPDGESVSIRYGSKAVIGGRIPTQAWDIWLRLDEIARSMPRIQR